jgi:four helix bundle protein
MRGREGSETSVSLDMPSLVSSHKLAAGSQDQQNNRSMGDFRNLIVYQKAFELAMEIKRHSERFPPEEKYSLTDQVRRSSRSVCINLAEGYRKRRYPAHFVAKVSDANMENAETQVWIDFALACAYLELPVGTALRNKADEIGRILQHIEDNPDKFLPKK